MSQEFKILFDSEFRGEPAVFASQIVDEKHYRYGILVPAGEKPDKRSKDGVYKWGEHLQTWIEFIAYNPEHTPINGAPTSFTVSAQALGTPNEVLAMTLLLTTALNDYKHFYKKALDKANAFRATITT